MNTIQELDRVVLTQDFPDDGLLAGDVGTAVLLHKGGALEVEVVLPTGAALAVVTAEPGQYRPLGPGDVPHVRTLPV